MPRPVYQPDWEAWRNSITWENPNRAAVIVPHDAVNPQIEDVHSSNYEATYQGNGSFINFAQNLFGPKKVASLRNPAHNIVRNDRLIDQNESRPRGIMPKYDLPHTQDSVRESNQAVRGRRNSNGSGNQIWRSKRPTAQDRVLRNDRSPIALDHRGEKAKPKRVDQHAPKRSTQHLRIASAEENRRVESADRRKLAAGGFSRNLGLFGLPDGLVPIASPVQFETNGSPSAYDEGTGYYFTQDPGVGFPTVRGKGAPSNISNRRAISPATNPFKKEKSVDDLVSDSLAKSISNSSATNIHPTKSKNLTRPFAPPPLPPQRRSIDSVAKNSFSQIKVFSPSRKYSAEFDQAPVAPPKTPEYVLPTRKASIVGATSQAIASIWKSRYLAEKLIFCVVILSGIALGGYFLLRPRSIGGSPQSQGALSANQIDSSSFLPSIWFKFDKRVTARQVSAAIQPFISVSQQHTSNSDDFISSTDSLIVLESFYSGAQLVDAFKNNQEVLSSLGVLYYVTRLGEKGTWEQVCAPSAQSFSRCGDKTILTSQITAIDSATERMCRLGRTNAPGCDQCLQGFYRTADAGSGVFDCIQCKKEDSRRAECQ